MNDHTPASAADDRQAPRWRRPRRSSRRARSRAGSVEVAVAQHHAAGAEHACAPARRPPRAERLNWRRRIGDQRIVLAVHRAGRTGRVGEGDALRDDRARRRPPARRATRMARALAAQPVVQREVALDLARVDAAAGSPSAGGRPPPGAPGATALVTASASSASATAAAAPAARTAAARSGERVMPVTSWPSATSSAQQRRADRAGGAGEEDPHAARPRSRLGAAGGLRRGLGAAARASRRPCPR